MKSICDIKYKDDLVIDLHLPESDSFDLFVYFHGGGLSGGTHKQTEVFAKTLAKRNIATASVEYRMYPNAKYPEFIEDCAFAVRYLKDNISKYGKCNRIFVGGSSAGGYISMMLCFDEKYLNAVGLDPAFVAGYIHDAGQPTAHFNVLKEFGEDSRRVIVDERAPMFHVGRAKDYSPMLFIVSDNDMFGRYEQTMLMVNVMKHFEHGDKVFLEVVNGTHCDYIYKTDESGEGKLAKMILSFIDKLDG